MNRTRKKNAPRHTAGLKNSAVFRTLAETAPAAILLFDARCSIIFCNRRAAAMFGCRKGKNPCGGKSLLDFIAPEKRDAVIRSLKKTGGRRQNSAFELSLAGKNTETDIALVCSAPRIYALFLHESGTGAKAIEKNRALDQQLRAVYKMESLGQLANGIAHDLNNSLGCISGYVELIKKADAGDEERIRKYADTIGAAVNRSARLIQHLLTFARTSPMQVVSFDVNECIADTVKLVESSLEQNIAIVQELSAKDAVITGDPEQLRNAIVNLTINGRDAMPEGGTLTIKTANLFIDEVFAKSHTYKMMQGYYLSITVSDTGSGMDPAVMKHLFEPFFSTKETGKGTGLGLPSVYGSIKNHHGYIEVESKPGQGTTFIMYFPISQTPPSGLIRNNRGYSEERRSAANVRHIMVVDDELSPREMLSELLTWLGYSVVCFADVREAIAYYGEHHAVVDISILDWKMPYFDGIECFRRIRKINPDARVLIATGYRLDSELQSLLREGVAGILPKPFVSADIAKAVADALGEHGEHGEPA